MENDKVKAFPDYNVKIHFVGGESIRCIANSYELLGLFEGRQCLVVDDKIPHNKIGVIRENVTYIEYMDS